MQSIFDIDKIKVIAKKAREESEGKKEVKEYSERAIKAAELCKEFGCNKGKVRTLVSFLINEELPEFTEGNKEKIRKLIPGVVYRKSVNNRNNSRSYKLGICIAVNTDEEGTIFYSNHSTEEFDEIELTEDTNPLSIATDKEIDEFFKKVNEQ